MTGFMVVIIGFTLFLGLFLPTKWLNSFVAKIQFESSYSYFSITLGQWEGQLILLVYLIGMSFCHVLLIIS